ncbi:hypothetical protein [Corallococcus sp. AS-1-6]|uniref:hypothetical protein n=1 Tax=Corallococcus sp. AS-1-6 TaxID=2874599 RepID=UPI001CC17CE1|nr:hypothetical protein [Corallococcus sp. AS-1-6]MBZ4373865.1 hypothetical protein [Corallococcus sp. AS-1-6]
MLVRLGDGKYSVTRSGMLDLVSALAVSGLFIWSGFARASFLLQSPHPMGVDGYYYAIQLRSLAEDWRLFYPSLPLCFVWLLPFSLLSDPIIGTKLGAAIATAAAVFPVNALARRFTGDRGAGLVAATLVAISAQSRFLSTEFVKQGVGLTLAAGTWALLGASLDRPSKGRFALALGLLSLTALTHRFAFCVALFVTLPVFVTWVCQTVDWKADRRSLLLLGGTVAVSVGVGVIWRLSFGNDFVVMSKLFQMKPDWSFATLALPGAPPLVFHHEVRWAAVASLLTLGLSSSPGAARASPLRGHVVAFRAGFVSLALFVAVPWLDISNAEGPAMRLRLVAFLPLAICAALVFRQCLGRLTPSVRLIVGAIMAVGLPWIPTARHEGTVTTAPSRVMAMKELAAKLPADSLVVTTERQLAFMVTWYARAPAQRAIPALLNPDRTFRLIPSNALEPDMALALAARRKRATGVDACPQDLLPSRPGSLTLLQEQIYQSLTHSLPLESQMYWQAWPAH